MPTTPSQRRQAQKRSATGAAIALFTLAMSGCAPLAQAPAAQPPAPRVYFVGLQEGDSVASPLKVAMAAQGFAVEAAGEARPGAGHLHIMVDTPCVAVGQGVPKDDTHLHYGKGQLEAELTLTPGRHTLCLQAADGNHVALAGEGMTQMMSITVK